MAWRCYRADLFDAQMKDGWEMELMNQPALNDVREEFDQWVQEQCKEKHLTVSEETLQLLTHEFLDTWGLDAEPDIGIGPLGLFAEYINRKYFRGIDVFLHRDECVIVPKPNRTEKPQEGEDWKAYHPTTWRIRQILKENLPLITDELPRITFMKMRS